MKGLEEKTAQKILMDNLSLGEQMLIEDSETLPDRLIKCMIEFAQDYHKAQLKAKMPSNSKIQTGINLANEIYFDGSRTTQRILMFGAKWLKQQIIKS